jgi:uncharacterized protein involved in exopolysaccharide biosynthesis
MEKSLPDFNLNGTNLVQMIWKRKVVLGIIALVAFISSLIAAMSITPLYKSTAILIPTVATQATKDIFVPTRPKGLTVFGDDEEVEHLLQILSSETLRRVVVDELNLFNHYGINPEGKHAWFRMNSTYSNNISFSPSRYRSIRIEVYDASPKMAAKIANKIVAVADSLTRESKRSVAKIALQVMERQHQLALKEIYLRDDSLRAIMKNGVLDLPYQTKEVTRLYAEAVANNNTHVMKRLEDLMKKYAKHGAEFTRHLHDIDYSSKQLVVYEENLAILRAEAEGLIPMQFVIDWAFPSDKNATPKKATIVAVSTLSALFFAIFLFVIVDFFRKSIMPASVEK